MSITPLASRPYVSATLEAALRSTVGKHGAVVWLDADGHYTGFVDRLAAAPAEDPARVPFALLAYRGGRPIRPFDPRFTCVRS